MLRKLTKHEFKATARYMLPLYLVLLVLTVLNRIMLNLDIYNGILSFVSNTMMVFYIVSIVTVAIITLIIMIGRFYKNLVTDEGYLTFTLPVKVTEIVNSKIIIAVLWTIISVILIFASIIIVSSTSLTDLQYILKLGYEIIKDTFANKSTLFITQLIILSFFSLINKILQVYASVAIGQLVNGHRLIGSIVAFVIINTVTQVIPAIILFVGAYFYGSSLDSVSSIPSLIFPITIIIILIFNFVFYYGTTYIFKNKLNLE